MSNNNLFSIQGSLQEIAQALINTDKKVQLIYAFNGTGKTRLTRELKDIISPKSYDEDGSEIDTGELSNKKVLYYSAFTEDLFNWNNDLQRDSEYFLEIKNNAFTRWVLDEQGQDNNIVQYFQEYTSNKLNANFEDTSTEGLHKKIRFSIATGDNNIIDNIKISKGQESNFIWSVFYSLLKQIIEVVNEPEISERETNQFDNLDYIIIDDPVSSLDENHLIQLAISLADLVKNKNQLKFIILTHNTLFYNVLFNELALNRKKQSCFMLNNNDNGSYDFIEKKGDSNSSFSYHLYLKDIIEQAIINNNIKKYHFMLLRNLYEKTASFLGYQRWSALLPDDENNVQRTYATRIMTFYSHSSVDGETIAEVTNPEKNMVKFLLNHLVENYNFFRETDNNTNGDNNASTN